jgi:hypothetical protein
MKKGISISLLALSLAACGGSSSSDSNNINGSSGITISSYSSDNATDTSPVGTWVAILTGQQTIDGKDGHTYNDRILFTITETTDNYIINSCGLYEPISRSVNKVDFLKAISKDTTASYGSSAYTQQFTSNISFISNSDYSDNYRDEELEKDTVERFVETASAIKITDSTDIKETISIDSQNADLATEAIEINCLSSRKRSDGIFTVEIESAEIESLNIDYGKVSSLYFTNSSKNVDISDDDEGADFDTKETSNNIDNFSLTIIFSHEDNSGTFNISVDFK